MGRTLLSAAFDFVFDPCLRIKIYVKSGGQECPPHTELGAGDCGGLFRLLDSGVLRFRLRLLLRLGFVLLVLDCAHLHAALQNGPILDADSLRDHITVSDPSLRISRRSVT